MEMSDVKPNDYVVHKKFGKGIITKIVKDVVYVSFDTSYGEKRFGFPSAFQNGHLIKKEDWDEMAEHKLNFSQEKLEKKECDEAIINACDNKVESEIEAEEPRDG